MRRTRVVIADRHPVVLHGLSSVLEGQRDFKIVALCADGTSCVKAMRMFTPDMAIIDISMPDIGGLQILTIASSENIPTRFVFFASSVQDRHLRMLAEAGAHAVIAKDVDPTTLVQILRRVANGQRLLQLPLRDPAIIREQGAIAEKALTALTDRERHIVRLVSEGLSNKEIGRRLNITDGTIKVHLHHVFQKLDIGNRTALAALAISQDDDVDLSLGKHGAVRRNRGRRRHH
jgi:two-component system, NarL family, nitrate/nitrite response regulator NarL